MKTAFKVLTTLSALAVLSGCPDKGGGGNTATVPAVATAAGIINNGECRADVATAYLYIKNNMYNHSNNDLMKTNCTTLLSLIGGQTCRIVNQNQYNNQYNQNYQNNQWQQQASMSDVQATCNAASGVANTTSPYPNNPYQPGYPNQPIQNMATKNLVCSINVSRGSSAGSIDNMPVKVYANGADLNLYSMMQNTRSYIGGYVNYTRTFSSESIVALKLKFKAGSGTVADTLSLSANLRNGKIASVTGFAGSEVRIEIAGDSDQDTSVLVSCAGQDNFNAGQARNGANLSCLIREDNNGKKTTVSIFKSMAEFENSEVKPIRNSNLALQSTEPNSLTTSVYPITAYESYKLTSGLTTPGTVKIRAPGYSLDSNCIRQ